jgi:hypothetical protein
MDRRKEEKKRVVPEFNSGPKLPDSFIFGELTHVLLRMRVLDLNWKCLKKRQGQRGMASSFLKLHKVKV